MKLTIGEKIRELRRRDGRTQEELANAMGVTCQAVSRWEANGGYPDMEIMPSIANYFGVSIDELFGYHGEREKKVDELLQKVDLLNRENLRGDYTIDECVTILREGLVEFPGNERIAHKLGLVLSNAGWKRHGEWLEYGDEGYLCHNVDYHKNNECWNEAICLFESLIDSRDSEIRTDSICNLVELYRNMGEYDKGIALAERLPKIEQCREKMLAEATDGKTQSMYIGELLLRTARLMSNHIVYGLINNITNFDTDIPIEKIKGAIALYDTICEDGNFGEYHDIVADLYVYLSRLQWERGYHDDAFESLDLALEHGKTIERVLGEKTPVYTSCLVKNVRIDNSERRADGYTEYLPTEWPIWTNPDYSEVEREIKADPRWDAWVKRCMER